MGIKSFFFLCFSLNLSFQFIMVLLIIIMTMLKIICWNYRGLTNGNIFNCIRKIIKAQKPSFVCLVETRLDESRVLQFVSSFRHVWEWATIPSLGYSGGIIILKRRLLGIITPPAISKRCLHLVIYSQFLVSWIISMVYNGQLIEAQKRLWRELDAGWCLMILGF